MEKVIVYKQDSGVLAIVRPTQEALERYGIELIAQKDVPFGKPFKIINLSDVPEDRTLRNAWTADDVDLNDGVGAAWNTFLEGK